MDLQRVGKYQVRGLLGRGGMGRVFLAWDPDLEREVAVKLLDPQRLRDPRAVARFAREARALGRLSSPHIVAIHAFEPEHDPPYLVMQRLVGHDLQDWFAQGRCLTPQQVRDAAWQCLQGLAAAHAAGIVHRDLKPSNIFLQRSGVYTLIDFGLATDGRDEVTADGCIVGTRAYLPPERAAGGEATPAGDLWSLGVTLCVLASGQPPAQCQADRLEELLPGQPAPVREWFRRLLASDPGARFPDAGAALAALPEADGGPTRLALLDTVDSGGSGLQTAVTATLRPLTEITQRVAPRQPVRRPLRFWLTLTVALWLVAAAAVAPTAWLMGSHAYRSHFEALRRRLAHIASAAVPLVDPALHDRLARNPQPDPEDLAALEVLRERLAAYIAAFPDVENIYTMAERPDTAETGIVQFICDASPERDKNGDGLIGDDERRARLHEPYPAKHLPGMLASFRVATPERTIIRDQWGAWLSASAPILLPDGRSAGLVGVDMSAEEVLALRDALILRTLLVLAAALVGIALLALLVARWLHRPLAELDRGLQALADGDHSVQLAIPPRSQFAPLANAFHRLRDELRQAAALRRSIDALIARALLGRTPASDASSVYLGARIDEQAVAGIARLVDAALGEGGIPEGVQGRTVILRFPRAYAGDVRQERAARIALGWLAAHAEHRPACAIAATPERLGPLLELGHRSRQDLLIEDRLFAPMRYGFVADRLHDPQQGALWSIKAAVSAPAEGSTDATAPA